MTTRVAINGFGRIGRCALRIALQRDDIEVVAINDPSPAEQSLLLFQFDSNYGPYQGTASLKEEGNILRVDNKDIKLFSTREITQLPWGDLDVDVVLECTGVFRTKEGAQKHIDQGAKKVLLSAPAKSEGFTTVVLGVNEEILTGKEVFVSNASCTTNCLAPVAKVLEDTFGIESGLMTTIHSYTNDQKILDVAHKDMRRARAAALNMIPTSTGAAKAVGLVLPELKGKLNGMAVRVPTPTVSLVDLTVKVKKETTTEEVNAAMKAFSDQRPEILGYEERPLVSMDFKGDARSSIFDPAETKVLGDLVKILSWYDNEWGYSSRFVELAARLGA